MASDPSGNFVVTWTSIALTGAEAVARRFDSNGAPVAQRVRRSTSSKPGSQAASGSRHVAGGLRRHLGRRRGVGGPTASSRRRFDAEGSPVSSTTSRSTPRRCVSDTIRAGRRHERSAATSSSSGTTANDHGYAASGRRFDAGRHARSATFSRSATRPRNASDPRVASRTRPATSWWPGPRSPSERSATAPGIIGRASTTSAASRSPPSSSSTRSRAAYQGLARPRPGATTARSSSPGPAGADSTRRHQGAQERSPRERRRSPWIPNVALVSSPSGGPGQRRLRAGRDGGLRRRPGSTTPPAPSSVSGHGASLHRTRGRDLHDQRRRRRRTGRSRAGADRDLHRRRRLLLDHRVWRRR